MEDIVSACFADLIVFKLTNDYAFVKQPQDHPPIQRYSNLRTKYEDNKLRYTLFISLFRNNVMI